MKVLGLIIAFAFVAQAVPVEKEAVQVANEKFISNAVILRLIEQARQLVLNGSPQLGIPVLDPLRVFAHNFNIPGQLLSMDLNVAGANMTGLGGFVVDRADFGLLTLRMHYDITFPQVSIRSAWYNLNGLIATIIPLYGNGIASFDVVDLRMVGTIQFTRNANGRLVIGEFNDAVFTLGDFVARTTGYIGGGEIDNVINNLLTDLVEDYVNRFSNHISFVVTGAIKVVGNSFLEHFDLWELIFG